MQANQHSATADDLLTLPTRNPVGTTKQWIKTGTPAFWQINFALFLVGFATFSLLYCVQPLLPLFATEFHVRPSTSALALSLTTGCLAIAILCAGAISEGINRRHLMFWSMSAASCLNLIAAESHSWALLLLARAFAGLLLGGVPAVAMAYLAEKIDPKGLGLSIGLYVGGTAFGGMAGRVGMSLITEFTSWHTAMATLGGIDLIAALGFFVLLPAAPQKVVACKKPMQEHIKVWRGHLRNPALVRLFAIGFLSMGVFVTIYNYAGFRLMTPEYGLSPAQIGFIFCSYIFGIVGSSCAGALADRFGPAPVLISCILIMAIGIVMTLAQPLAMIILGIVVVTAGFFMTHAVASGWVGRLAGPAKGHATSLYLLAYYMGSSFIGASGGLFWEMDGWWVVVAYALALMVITFALALRLHTLANHQTSLVQSAN